MLTHRPSILFFYAHYSHLISVRTRCQHSFNKGPILEFLKDGEKQCPATGCRVRLNLGSVQPDPELAKRAELFQKRAKRREEEQDDAEELSD
jgi:SUMO ligase MMS21 Smc5/6 complex component